VIDEIDFLLDNAIEDLELFVDRMDLDQKHSVQFFSLAFLEDRVIDDSHFLP
jgi:hypothetical protein